MKSSRPLSLSCYLNQADERMLALSKDINDISGRYDAFQDQQDEQLYRSHFRTNNSYLLLNR